MRIKYKVEIRFDKRLVLTDCPNGNDCKVHSELCYRCNFYQGKALFRNIVKCSFNKKGNIK